MKDNCVNPNCELHWTSVEDGLPELIGCCGRLTLVRTEYGVGVSWFFKRRVRNDNGELTHWVPDSKSLDNNDKTTYWMRIPKEPKGGE